MVKKLQVLIFILILSLFSSGCSQNIEDLSVVIIDVGQGDSSLIVTPDRKSLLIDCGKEEYCRDVLKNVKRQRLNHIDYFLATHHDSDHIGSMDQIIDVFPVSTVLLSEETSDKKEYLQVLSSCKKKNLAPTIIRAGDSFDLGKDCKVYVLAPKKISSDSNKNSLVLLIEYKGNNLLFTGDADQDVERQMVMDYDLPHCVFLKVGHHGSKTSTSTELMEAIQPEVSTISCGYNNSYGHPHDITISTLRKYNSKIYRTDENRDMIFYFDKQGMYLKEKYSEY